VNNKYLFPLLSSVVVVLSACGSNDTNSPLDAFQVEVPVFYLERPADALTDTDPRDNFKLTAVNGANQKAGNLWLKLPGQDAINVTGSITAANTATNKGPGDVMSPSLSYNGTRLVFSMFVGLNNNLNNDDPNQNHWNLWVYEISDPTNPNFTPYLHRLFSSPNLSAGELADEENKGNDLEPVFLPDNRIVFTSDRQKSLRSRFNKFGASGTAYLDENRGEPALNLHIINGDGDVETIHQISTNVADERQPTVIEDGRIVFSRWELSREGGKNQFDLFSIYPDGSHLQILYGAHSHGNSAATTVFSKPQQMPDGRLLSVMTSFNGFDPNDITTINQSNFGGGDLVYIDYKGYVDVDTPRSNGSPMQSAGHVSATPGDVLSGPGLSLGGRYENFAPIWQSGGGSLRAMVSWTPCRVATGTAPDITYTVCDNGGTAALEPVYGLHILNLATGLFDGQFALPPAGSGMVYVDPVVVADRNTIFIDGKSTTPQVLVDHNGAYYSSDLAAEGTNGYAAVHIRSIYDSDRLLQLGLQDNLPAGTTLPLTGGGRPDLNRMADPTQTPPDMLPVRFVRIISPGPTFSNNDVNGFYFGVNGARMRTVLGYAPVQPDGSVYVKVPSNVPFAFELVDKNGRKLVRQNQTAQFHRNWLNLMSGEIVTCNGCHEGHTQTSPLNTGFAGGAVAGVISLAAQASMNSALTSQINGGETMAGLLARLSIQQPALVASTYAEMKRDLVYQDYWTDPAATPAVSFAIEYNDTDYSDGNQGLIYTTMAPVLLNSCAPTDYSNPLSNPNWNIEDCAIVSDYLTHIQPMWEVTRPVGAGTGACIDCHGTVSAVVDPVTNMNFAQVPAGETQLDLTNDNAYRFINNDEDRRAKSYEEMVHRGIALQLDATGFLLEKVTQNVPDGMGGTITVDVSVTGTLAIGTNQEARNSRLIRILTGQEAIGTVDHTTMMTASEIRVLAEWIDLGTQYTNDVGQAGP